MSSRKRRLDRCQGCGEEFGTKCEPGEFVFNPILKRAGVAQLCKSCLSLLPVQIGLNGQIVGGVIFDLRRDPKGFADRARLHRKYHDPNNYIQKLDFGDERKVIRVNPEELTVHRGSPIAD